MAISLPTKTVESTAPAAPATRPRNLLLWGVKGYLFLVIFRPYEYWEWLNAFPVGLERLYIIGLLAAILFSPDRQKVAPWTGKSLVLFFGAMFLSTIFAYRSEPAFEALWFYFKLLVLYYVITVSIRNKDELKDLVLALLVITGLYAGKSLWEFLFNGRHFYRMGIVRLIGIDKTYNDPNTFAATLIYTLPFAWAIWKTEISARLRSGLLLYGSICVVSLAFTGSRMGALALVFFLFYLWLGAGKKARGLLLIAVLLMVVWANLAPDYQDRLMTLIEPGTNKSALESANGRINGLMDGLALFGERPVLGWGPGNFVSAKHAIGLRLGDDRRAHNLYGEVLGELGLAGLAVLTFMGVSIYRCNRAVLKMRKRALADDAKQKQDLFVNIAWACNATLILLFLLGNFGHNLYRYNWVLLCAITDLTRHYAQLAPSGTTFCDVIKL